MAYIPQVNQYAQLSDLYNYGITAASLSHPSTGTSVQTQCLLAASAEMDGAFSQQHTMPIQSWGTDVVMYCCWLATFQLIMIRGYDPENKADQIYKNRWDMAQSWLERIKKDRRSTSIIDSSTNAQPFAPSLLSSPGVSSPAPYDAALGNQTRGTNYR